MAHFIAKVVRLYGAVLVLLAAVPVQADPFFVRVYGRTYKVDPRSPSTDRNSPKAQEIMKALPADIGRGPGFRPSHEQVLAEVEERTWIARNELDVILAAGTVSRGGRYAGTDETKAEPKITGTLPPRASRAGDPKLQTLYNRHAALTLLVGELRRSMDLPAKTPEKGFSRPTLSPEIEAEYRSLNFDPLEAYYGFRRVKAAFRSGDIEVLARVTRYPLSLIGRIRRTIRNPDQLLAAEDTVMSPRIREIVANSSFETVFVRDKGMMLGEGQVWITPDKTEFKLGTVTVE